MKRISVGLKRQPTEALPITCLAHYPARILLALTLLGCGDLQVVAEIPPYTHSQSPTLVTGSSAMLNGMAVPNGLSATAWFEWGTRGDFSQTTTPTFLGAAAAVVRVSAPLSGLASRGQYQYRLAVSNNLGVVRGATQLFQTGGRLTAWGRNWYGVTNVPTDLGEVVVVDAGSEHCVALKPDGTLVSWGAYSFGQTNVPSGLSNVVAVDAGGAFTLALKENGTVVAWGQNHSKTNVPANLSNVIAVAAGNHHSLALKTDGSVVGWGMNDHGQATVPAGLSNVVAIAAGAFHSLGLRANGTVVCWGTNTPGANVPPGLTNVVAISAGWEHSLALKSDGKVSGWGTYWFDSVNQPMYVPASLNSVVSISTGQPQSLALRSDGRVVAWGGNYYDEATVPPNLSNVVSISAGEMFNVTLGDNTKPDSLAEEVLAPANRDVVISLKASDLNGDVLGLRIATLPTNAALYQFDAGGRGTPIIASGTAVTDPKGRVIFAPPTNAFGWPYSMFTFVANDGAADSLPSVITVNVGQPQACSQAVIHIRPTGATLAGMAVPNGLPSSAWFIWGTPGVLTNITPQVDVGEAYGVVRVTTAITGLTDSGRYQCRLVVSNSAGVTYGALRPFSTGMRVIAWGDNSYNQRNLPAHLTNAVAIASGFNHGVALKSDGALAIWGDSRFGQANVPPGLTNLLGIATALSQSLALKPDGTVVAWPNNNVPPGLSNVISIAAGWHYLALKADGTVVAWGVNQGGSTDVPPGLSNVVAIAAGTLQSLALLADGTIVGWGYTNYINPYVPAHLRGVVDLAASTDSLALLSDGTIFAWDGSGPRAVPTGLNGVRSLGRGTYHKFAVKENGTLIAWGSEANNNYGEASVPSNLVAVMAAAGGNDHSYALGTRTPTVSPLNPKGVVNGDIVVALQAFDPDGDPIVVKIAALPSVGMLFQYAAGSRGHIITSAGEVVMDSLRRVIFAPATNQLGSPYATFSYRAEDALSTSANAAVTVSIVLPAAPVFNARNCGWIRSGGYELNFSGQTNGVYRVWGSTNLVNWTLLGQANATSNGWFNFVDAEATDWHRRFYRAGAP